MPTSSNFDSGSLPILVRNNTGGSPALRSQVQYLRTCLRGQGFVLPEDDPSIFAGFDHYAHAAVIMFQRRAGLTVDGKVGPLTWTALHEEDAVVKELLPVSVKKVPYFPQRDNIFVPTGTCNVTALAMLMAYHRGCDYFKNKQMQPEDYLFSQLQTDEARSVFLSQFPWAKRHGYNPRNVHGMLSWLAREKHGFEGRFTQGAGVDEIFEHLVEYGPVILSGKFTASGHIVLLVGSTPDGDYVVHDPWGDWNIYYMNKGWDPLANSYTGKNAIYPKERMEEVLNGSSGGRYWAHFYR